jgi:hypothetical protein
MPPVGLVLRETAGSDQADANARRAAAFKYLIEVVAQLAGNRYPNRLSPDEQTLVATYQGALREARRTADGPDALRLFATYDRDPAWRAGLLQQLAPRIAALIEAKKSAPPRADAAEAPGKARFEAAEAVATTARQDAAKARDAGAQIKVFDLPLGEPLQIDACDQASDGQARCWTPRKGIAVDTRGNAGMETAKAQLESMFATYDEMLGEKPPASKTLPDGDAVVGLTVGQPSYAFSVVGEIENHVLAGVMVGTNEDSKAVLRDLIRRYGKPAHREEGRVFQWEWPGLRVRYVFKGPPPPPEVLYRVAITPDGQHVRTNETYESRNVQGEEMWRRVPNLFIETETFFLAHRAPVETVAPIKGDMLALPGAR